MQRSNLLTRMERTGAMAIVRTKSIERAHEIAQGCLDGGIDVLEISYTYPNAGEVIAALKETFGARLAVGAGTVLEGETARLALVAGAEFVISPNFNERAARLCNLYQTPYCPGCSTGTEIVEALELGASLIKAFPISNFYGSELVRTYKTPMPYIPILASGGITLENLHEWVEAGTEICAFGSLLTKGTSAEIAANARKIRTIIDRCRGK
ncbi:MAG TPA: ketohydroxyglutarate aldolase [Pseudoflavonifractor sp.]|nr:ketohydroxyglutarate aldolase [Pseudoflavonifractor sp.]